jgi:hypothetical protein
MSILKNENVLIRSLLCLIVLFSLQAEAEAVEVFLPHVKVKRGNTFTVPIMIDQVDNVAGVKLILTYDPDLLHFKEGHKTPKSQSMMHIINDKKPGRLIIVMASAKGIGGKDFALLQLTFQAMQQEASNREVKLDIVEAQIMSDQLKEAPCRVKSGVIKIE